MTLVYITHLINGCCQKKTGILTAIIGVVIIVAASFLTYGFEQTEWWVTSIISVWCIGYNLIFWYESTKIWANQDNAGAGVGHNIMKAWFFCNFFFRKMKGYTLSFVFQDEYLYHYDEQVLLWKANNSGKVCKQNVNGLWVHLVEVITKGHITNSVSEYASNAFGTNTFGQTPKAGQRPSMGLGKYSFS